MDILGHSFILGVHSYYMSLMPASFTLIHVKSFKVNFTFHQIIHCKIFESTTNVISIYLEYNFFGSHYF